MALLGSALLAGFTTRAEGTICLELPVVTVKEVKGVAVLESGEEGSAEEALPGVRVRLFREEAKDWTFVAEALTDAEGRFYLANIGPGSYKIKADLAGLRETEGRLRVRRFFPGRRGALVLVLVYPAIDSCAGWIELRKTEAEPRGIGGA